jgi:hypothetical protein
MAQQEAKVFYALLNGACKRVIEVRRLLALKKADGPTAMQSRPGAASSFCTVLLRFRFYSFPRTWWKIME